MKGFAEGYALAKGTRVFKKPIREAIAVMESQSVGKDTYAPKAKVTEDYASFIAKLKGVLNNV